MLSYVLGFDQNNKLWFVRTWKTETRADGVLMQIPVKTEKFTTQEEAAAHIKRLSGFEK